MKKSTFFSSYPRATKTSASLLAQSILRQKPLRHAAVVGLVGELGSGKTTFAQGFAKGLGVKEKIASPTFVIYKTYRTYRSDRTYIHADCYRLKNPKELLALGWEKIIADPRNIVLVEWADRIKSILPRKTIFIHFQTQGLTKRTLQIS
ncbi:MAG: tRNA (adenosine(37)-N6)-threonylcarbamoyltransferase complex ATPase subunit type 1 TsaE [Candidatus Wildermuthbacteria bacterium]|nr:tRNA (adenosine(37)-N6)-threonylcarbamoyltransferase complex ATPase subunit type 1 TsaE [Candidatus Wildermuthbacteria bacterium]